MDYAYLRVSTGRQELGPEAQYQSILVAANKTEMVRYKDVCGGGTQPHERPAFMEMLSVLKPGDVVWVARRDRIGRDVFVTAAVERLIQRIGGSLKSADGIGNGDTPEDKLIANIVDAISQYERALISMRTKAALGALKRKGKYIGGRIPYGYRLMTDHLEPDYDAQLKIAHLIKMKESGMTYLQIQERFARKGWKSPRGERVWSRQSLADMYFRWKNRKDVLPLV